MTSMINTNPLGTSIVSGSNNLDTIINQVEGTLDGLYFKKTDDIVTNKNISCNELTSTRHTVVENITIKDAQVEFGSSTGINTNTGREIGFYVSLENGDEVGVFKQKNTNKIMIGKTPDIGVVDSTPYDFVCGNATTGDLTSTSINTTTGTVTNLNSTTSTIGTINATNLNSSNGSITTLSAGSVTSSGTITGQTINTVAGGSASLYNAQISFLNLSNLIINGNAGEDKYLRSDSAGNATWKTLPVGFDVTDSAPVDTGSMTLPTVTLNRQSGDIHEPSNLGVTKPRTIPTYNGVIRDVASQTELNNALTLSVAGDIIRITTNFFASSTITINKAIKLTATNRTTAIIGQTSVQTTLNITSDNTLLEGLTIINASANSGAVAITYNNTSHANNYINSCNIVTNEYGVYSTNTQIQITNCAFSFQTPPADGNWYIWINRTTGTTIISNNTFSGNGADTSLAVYMDGTGTNYTGGRFVFSNNNNTNLSRLSSVFQSDAIFTASNIVFELSDNYFFCANYGFLFNGNPCLGGVYSITAISNTVIGHAFGGLINLDSTTVGSIINTNVIVESTKNAVSAFSAGIFTQLTNQNINVIGYRTTQFPVVTKIDSTTPKVTSVVLQEQKTSNQIFTTFTDYGGNSVPVTYKDIVDILFSGFKRSTIFNSGFTTVPIYTTSVNNPYFWIDSTDVANSPVAIEIRAKLRPNVQPMYLVLDPGGGFQTLNDQPFIGMFLPNQTLHGKFFLFKTPNGQSTNAFNINAFGLRTQANFSATTGASYPDIWDGTTSSAPYVLGTQKLAFFINLMIPNFGGLSSNVPTRLARAYVGTSNGDGSTYLTINNNLDGTGRGGETLTTLGDYFEFIQMRGLFQSTAFTGRPVYQFA